jgi:hypothetical protein
MVHLTMFNCGTGYTRYRQDVVAQLYNEAKWGGTQVKVVTDGVGTTSGWDEEVEHTLSDVGSGKIRGNLFAKGLKENVRQMVETVVDTYKKDPQMTIDMLGWSRGAVTCFKIANRLSRPEGNEPAGISQIPVRIFAIDPVPGSAGAANKHMWKNIELTKNVKAFQIVLAQHETRRSFAPVLPRLRDGLHDAHLIVMPGNHSGIVEPLGHFQEPYLLVKDLAKRFLLRGQHPRLKPTVNDPGGSTEFYDPSCLSYDKILHLYASLSYNFDPIKKLAASDGSNWYGMQAFGARRTVKSMDKSGKTHKDVGKISREKKSFYVNDHHKYVMRMMYPIIHDAIINPQVPKYTYPMFLNVWNQMKARQKLSLVCQSIRDHFADHTGYELT